MNFANVKNITIPEGSVTKITDSLGRILWKKNVTPTEPDYFWVESFGTSCYFYLDVVDNSLVWPDPVMFYKIGEDGEWRRKSSVLGINNAITVPVSTRIYLRANNESYNNLLFRFAYSSSGSTLGSHKIGGNIATLIKEDGNISKFEDHCFSGFFKNDTFLLNAEEMIIPNVTLGWGCFAGCFYNCNKLTKSPRLLPEKMSAYCYSGLFGNCSKLTEIYYCGNTLNNTSNCTEQWVDGVNISNSNVFYKKSSVTSVYGASGIPIGGAFGTKWKVVNID